MNARLEWLRQRQAGIGGSDIAAVIGVSPFATPLDVYLSKTTPVEEQEQSESERMAWGHRIEPLIVAEFERRHNTQVVRYGNLIRRVKEKPWMFATLDGSFTHVNGEPAVLECKNVDSLMARRFWGSEEAGEAPATYIAQVQWQMLVTGYKFAVIAVLVGGNEYREYHITADEEIQAQITDAAANFWLNHVLPKIPPPWKNLEDVKRLYARGVTGLTVQADEWLLRSISEFKAEKQVEKALDETMQLSEAAIRIRIGAAERIINVVDDKEKVIATLNEQSRTSIDMDKLEKEYPEAYQDCLKVSTFRVLRVK